MNNLKLASQEPALVEAAEWMLELQSKHLSEERLTAWQRWLTSDARHQHAFDQLQTIQECIDAIPELPWPDESEIAPAHRRWHRGRLGWLAGAGLTGLAAGILGAIAFKAFDGQLPFAASGTVYETAVGELRRVQLRDGSTVTVGGDSRVTVRLRAEGREVQLNQGEAFFEVTPDPKRPFVVHAGETAIRAIGTAFDVRRTGQHVTVAVAEGVVEVRRPQDLEVPARLDAGQQVRIEPRGAAVTAKLAPEAVASWREGRRQYLAEPLRDVVADLNRYCACRIEITDPGIAELAVTGAVLERDTQRWLKSLEAALPVKVRVDGEGGVWIGGRE